MRFKSVKSRVLRLVSAALFLLVIIANSVSAPAQAATLGSNGALVQNNVGVSFVVQAHRGGASKWPENSVEAFAGSVAAGVDFIETDIIFTSDKVGVMSHNDTLPSRCTKAGKTIHSMTLAEVREVRCADLNGVKRVPIPTFEEVATVIKNSSTGLVLDIKTYTKQSVAGRQADAWRVMELLDVNGLIERSRLTSFYWDAILPTIRAYGKYIHVSALNENQVGLAKPRLAAQLGADCYGMQAKNTSAYFARYVKAQGIDSCMWEAGAEPRRSFLIQFCASLCLLSADNPTSAQSNLLSGAININPVSRQDVTTLPKAVSIAKKAKHKANAKTYPKVIGSAVPSAKAFMLEYVTVKIKVTKGSGSGYLYVGASGSLLADSARIKIPNGTKTLTLRQIPVGDSGKIRIYSSKAATWSATVTDYTNLVLDVPTPPTPELPDTPDLVSKS